MNETDAKAWIAKRVPRETYELVEQFTGLVVAENARQNLIASGTIATMWARHVVDSAQLLDLAEQPGRWLDLGAGAGFPGMIVGCIGDHHVSLSESRTKRVEFLNRAIAILDIPSKVDVRAGRIETLRAEPYDIISARAFAPLDRLFASAFHLSSPATRWILPKGRSAKVELEAASVSWQGSFSIAASITDPDAAIIVATNVRPRAASAS